MKAKNYTIHIAILILGVTLLFPIVQQAGFGFMYGKSAGNADYAIFEGVAGNDYYASMQYSYQINQWYNGYAYTPANAHFYASKSLRVGMTEYGELATPQNAGLAYGENATEWANTESWAPSAVPDKDWIQGWVLYLNYTRQTYKRCLLAWSLYSDFNVTEGGRSVYTWDGNYLSNDTVHNQLTQGSLSTSGIEVLYDSARLAIARTTVIIHDNVYSEDVCQLTFTLVFNKDSKYAILYKDYKTLLDTKVLDEINEFAFSERYELDMARGVNPGDSAYIHYYHNSSNTVYQHPLTGDKSYDVIQAFDPQKQYTFFAGYWPNATEYSVYSPLVPRPATIGTTVLSKGTAIADIPDPSPSEPNTPWVVVQWRYTKTDYPIMLHWLAKKDTQREIRFVEAFGMTDFNPDPHPAKDFKVDGSNQIDTEVLYLLDYKVFNPEDLTTLNWNSAYNDPFMWVGLGQSAATTDSGGAGMISQLSTYQYAPLTLFDRADELFPWTWSGGLSMKGTIPYGLSEWGGTYYEQFSNSGKGTGTDTTSYKRTTLQGFAFGVYDGIVKSPPQPIAGGYANASYTWNFWYPSKDPLTERWNWTGTSWVLNHYDNVTWNPNGIISLGGMKANGLTRYFNDFDYAITREGSTAYALINGGTVTGSAPTSDFAQNSFDYFPISTWNSARSTFGYKEGYAVISLARDINGTRGLSIYGWDGRDTYWAAAWASQYLGMAEYYDYWIPPGTVSLILNMTYSATNREPTAFTIVKALGTITELGTNAFAADLAHGFDKESPPHYWAAYDAYLKYLPKYPTAVGYPNVWWFEKLPTSTAALVDFDN